MNVIAKKTLLAFADNHEDARTPLLDWYTHVRKANFATFADVRADYGSADWVQGHMVFNIGGNKFRLIVTANFQFKTFWIKHVFTHEEYDAWTP